MQMTPEIQQLFLIFVLFQFKQFFCDFAWQTSKMVMMKASPRWDFAPALAAHAGIHAAITLLIILVLKPHLWWIALIDFTIHFLVDRVKSGPKYLGKFNDITRHSYWKVFGLDQMAHHFTHYLIIFFIYSL